MTTQICNKCNAEKELTSEFFGIEPRVKSGFTRICRDCLSIIAKERRIKNHSLYLEREAEKRQTPEYQQYQKSYYVKNDNVIKQRSKNSYYDNPEPFLQRSKEQKKRLGDKYKQYLKQYRVDNRLALNAKRLQRLRTDICFRLRCSLGNSVRKGLKGLIKKSHTIDYIGCSFEYLKQHLEKQFTSEMTWENHGTYWHIDHIVPCACFDFSIDNEIKKCFNYENLRPLKAEENLSKQDKLPDGTLGRNLKT
jgi:hypothetical protein